MQCGKLVGSEAFLRGASRVASQSVGIDVAAPRVRDDIVAEAILRITLFDDFQHVKIEICDIISLRKDT